MRFLVVGLGSMGKRRVRCLQALGYNDIIGFDAREDRRHEATQRYGIATVASLEGLSLSGLSAMIVSVPPDRHADFAIKAVQAGLPVFIEASVVLEDVYSIRSAMRGGSIVAPSCTLRFHPIIKDITRIVQEGRYGKVTNFSYHSGQYLPDWHPWEKVSDFYVSNRATGGGREIVPFELTWMVDTLGWPVEAKGCFRKTMDVGAEIEDSYAFVLSYADKVGTVIVDVAARYAVRNLVINLEKAQIQWKWDDACFSLYEVETGRWIRFEQPEFSSASGYNKNIGEQMYIDELASFICSFTGGAPFPNSIDDDIRVLEILKGIEDSDGGFKRS